MIFNITSNFKPFTFDDLAKPMLMYKQAYEDLEKNLATLTDQTEMWKSIAEQDKSPIAYNLYKTYSDKLSSIVDDFSRGMTASNRGELLNLRRGYATNIVPVANAFNRRQKLQDEVAKAKLTNPTYEFQYDPNKMSLDTLIQNPDQTWGKVINGALVNQEVATAAQALAKGAAAGDQASLEQLRQLTLPYQWAYIKRTGFNYSDILKVMQDNPDANPILKGLVDSAIEATGVYEWDNIRDKDGNFTDDGKALIQRLRHQGNMGLYQAIGQEQTQILTDSYSSQLALQQAAAAAAGQEDPDIPDGVKVDTDELTFGGSSVQEQAAADAKLLGFSPDFKKRSNHVTIPISMSKESNAEKYDKANFNRHSALSQAMNQAINPPSSIKVRLWGETGKYGTTGKILTKSQFVAQGKDAIQKNALARYYDQAIEAKNRWVRGKAINEQMSVAGGLQSLHGNFAVKGIRYNGDDNLEIISPFVNNRQLVKIQGVDSHGNIKLNRDGINHGVGMSEAEISSFNKKAHPDSGSPTLTKGQVSIHILPGDTTRPNNKGIVITMPDEKGRPQSYLLPYKAMTGNTRAAYDRYNNYIIKAEKEAKQNGFNAEQTKQYVDSVREQQLSALMRDINFAMQGTYGKPSVSTYKNPD